MLLTAPLRWHRLRIQVRPAAADTQRQGCCNYMRTMKYGATALRVAVWVRPACFIASAALCSPSRARAGFVTMPAITLGALSNGRFFFCFRAPKSARASDRAAAIRACPKRRPTTSQARQRWSLCDTAVTLSLRRQVLLRLQRTGRSVLLEPMPVLHRALHLLPVCARRHTQPGMSRPRCAGTVFRSHSALQYSIRGSNCGDFCAYMCVLAPIASVPLACRSTQTFITPSHSVTSSAAAHAFPLCCCHHQYWRLFVWSCMPPQLLPFVRCTAGLERVSCSLPC